MAAPGPPHGIRRTTPRNSGGPNLILCHSREIGVRISSGDDFSTISARTDTTRRPRDHHVSLVYGRARRHEIPGAGTDVTDCCHPYLRPYLLVGPSSSPVFDARRR